jgi:hypothetical protein
MIVVSSTRSSNTQPFLKQKRSYSIRSEVIEGITKRLDHPEQFGRKDIVSQREVLEDVGKKLNISSMDDWYNVTSQQIAENGGKKLLYPFDNIPRTWTMIITLLSFGFSSINEFSYRRKEWITVLFHLTMSFLFRTAIHYSSIAR